MIDATRSPHRRLGWLASVTIGWLIAAVLVPGADAGVVRWSSGGPEGGAFSVLGVDPGRSGVVYAATADGRVSKSATFGSIWAPLGTIPISADRRLTAIVADPTNGALLYAATTGDGIFKSTDGGRTWSPSSPGLTDRVVLALAIDPRIPATLYAGTNSGRLFKSTNGAGGWIPSNNGLFPFTEVVTIAVDPQTPTTLYLGHGFRGVFRSTDEGASWLSRNAGLGPAYVSVLVIDPQTPTTLYAGSVLGVFKTSNSGEAWGPSGFGLPGGFVGALVIDPEVPTTLYTAASSHTLFRSIDGGASWSPRNSGLPSPFVSVGAALAVDPKITTTVYASTAGAAPLASGVFRSTDAGGNWIPSSAGIVKADVRALALDPQTPATLYSATLNGVFKSTSGGATWRPSNAGLTLAVDVLAVDPQTPQIAYAGAGAGVVKTTNGGATWIPTGLVGFGQFGDATTALAVDPQTPSTLYAGTCVYGFIPVCNLFKSTNAGTSWTIISTGSFASPVNAVAIDPQTPATVYAATEQGVFKSTNGGASWTASNAGLTGIAGDVVIDPATPSVLYAGTVSGGVFRSTNGGGTWEPRNSGLSNLAIRALAIDPHNPAVLYASTNGSGVFRTTNAGASWATFNAGLGNPFVSALAVSLSGLCVHAATAEGVYDLATQPSVECPSPPTLVSAVLPASRSVRVGTAATAFATIIAVADPRPILAADEGDASARSCGITQLTGVPTTFTFQTTDPVTNQPIGTPNTPVDVAPSAAATFVMSLTPTAAFCPQDVAFAFNCSNVEPAPTIVGLNTLLLTASDTPVPDLTAVAATPSGDGYVTLAGPTGVNVFAMATTNVGVTGNITVSADTGGATLPVSVSLCQTNPVTAQCLAPPAPTVTLSIGAGATPTFAAFVSGGGIIADSPATNRVFVRLKDAVATTCGGTTQSLTRGSASVAVRTQ